MNWTGLAAQIWDPSGGDEPQTDYEFIRTTIADSGQPALDVGCGTGRLLLRYLADGMDVDGVDTSEDMLAICRAKAAERGLPEPDLYQMGMQELDLPRRYQTVYVPCGTFVLLTGRDDAWQALLRFYAHLEPGGVLLLNTFWPFDDGGPLSEKPLGGMNEWGKLWDHRLPDGRLVKQTLKNTKIDRVEQLLFAKRRYQLVDEAGSVVEEEIFDSNERWYYKHEMILMLERVGFHDVQVLGNWQDEAFDEEKHYSMVFVAYK